MCSFTSNKVGVKRYFNEGKSTQPQLHSTIGLTNIVVTNENGLLRCKFNRTKEMSSIPNYYSLNSSYYVLLARGDLDGGKYKLFE